MKTKIINRVTLALLPVALLALDSCSSTSPPPPVGAAKIDYKRGVPGGLVIQTAKIRGTVTDIDRAERKATLQAPDGKKSIVRLGPQAANLDKIGVGDQIIATITQKVVVSLDDREAVSPDGGTPLAAPSGEKDAPVAETIQTAAKVVAIDLHKRTTTLRFQDGTTETFPVREDVDLSRHKLGEQVLFRVTETLVIGVEKVQ